MKKILLITHGNVAIELKRVMEEFFMSKHQIDAISFDSSEDMFILKEKIELLDYDDSDEVLVFVDIVSGTPYNVANVMFKNKAKVIYGVNLPLLFIGCNSNDFDVTKIVNEAKESIGSNYGH